MIVSIVRKLCSFWIDIDLVPSLFELPNVSAMRRLISKQPMMMV
jgi:hypothetical protein